MKERMRMNGGAIVLQRSDWIFPSRETLRGELNAFQVDADLILQRFAFGEYPRVIHNAGMMEHIFGKMYLYLKFSQQKRSYSKQEYDPKIQRQTQSAKAPLKSETHQHSPKNQTE